MLVSYGDELLAPYPLFMLVYHPFSAVCDCVFSIFAATLHIWSRVSSDSIVSDYGLDDRAIGVRSPVGAKDFSSSLCVQTGSGGPPSLLYNGYRGSFPRG
jgi:hypothetical protein